MDGGRIMEELHFKAFFFLLSSPDDVVQHELVMGLIIRLLVNRYQTEKKVCLCWEEVQGKKLAFFQSLKAIRKSWIMQIPCSGIRTLLSIRVTLSQFRRKNWSLFETGWAWNNFANLRRFSPPLSLFEVHPDFIALSKTLLCPPKTSNHHHQFFTFIFCKASKSERERERERKMSLVGVTVNLGFPVRY